ncbi:MAG: gliding motility-associated C-terminal domain-containing protein [Crocinitomicaceae bacterium]|nr:gliding motility-associated C-terminal domain-containing protein [Crocinitomicaceae bacterium]
MTKLLFAITAILLSFVHIAAQTDTTFWFVAPEVASSHGDRPIVMRFASLNQPATIFVSQPANPSFPPQTIVLGINEAQTLDLTPWIDMIENKPADAVLNYGFKISSTSSIMAYYEINPTCACNPDIFTLKGRNGLGTSFFTPFQSYLNNASYARSAFNIVATEDNTNVTITPTQGIVGHAANTPFTIVLNKGQTYSAEATSTLASLHPGGSYVSSNRPVAITISDDTMEGTPYGGCADIMGDQIVPVPITGDEYIAIKGYLNGPDKVYVLAVSNATNVFVDGGLVATLNSGQTYTHTLSNPTAYVTSSAQVYVLHTSGFGCEVGGALLPPVECTGSNSVAFVRSTNEFFALNILVPAGGENSFVLNGDPLAIPASAFQPVAGTNNSWMYAQFNASSVVPTGMASRLENNQFRFHLGVIHGGSNTGCRYGYFSDYASYRYQIELTSEVVCEGDELNMVVASVPGGLYQWSGPNNFTATGNEVSITDFSEENSGEYIISGYEGLCAVLSDTAEISIHYIVTNNIQEELCQGNSYLFGDEELNVEGIYLKTFSAATGCDSIVTLQLDVNPVYQINVNEEICNGETYSFNGSSFAESGSYPFMFQSAQGCDSLVILNLELNPIYSEEVVASICEGESFSVGENSFDLPGVYEVVLQTSSGCDSLVNLYLDVNPLYELTLPQTICQGESYNYNGINYIQTGSYPHAFLAASGCDSLVTLDLFVNPVYSINQPVSLCPGEVFQLGGNTYSEAGVYEVPLTTANGCDSVVTLNISSYENYFVEVFDTACYNQPYIAGGYVFTEAGLYELELLSSHGCDSLVSLHLFFYPEGYSDYFFPNVFTPNGDDKNKGFGIEGSLHRIGKYEFVVYNRWGTEIFRSEDPYIRWNGEGEANEINEGVYYYIAKYTTLCSGSSSSEEGVLKGNVTLMK